MTRSAAALALSALGLALPAAAAGLNDTGQTLCHDGTALVACDAATTGDAATHPRQDGRFGRDAQSTVGALTKAGGGDAGFDFTPLDAAGNAIAVVNGLPASPHSCVHDNVTGLTWEVKSDDDGLRDKDWTYTWYDSTNANPGTPDTGTGVGLDNCLDPARCDTEKFVADVNAAGLCGFNTGWRMPTRRELLSLAHRGRWSPAIDTDYFPNTQSAYYRSAEKYAPVPADAWIVSFNYGSAGALSTGSNGHVRLVRSGQ